MAKTKQMNQSTDAASSGDLGVLIEAERKLEARLDGVQGEAKAIVAGAQTAAHEADQQLEAELKEAAKRDRRSMNRLVEVLIIQHCAANDITAPAKRTTKKGS